MYCWDKLKISLEGKATLSLSRTAFCIISRLKRLIETSSQDETKKYSALADVPYLIKQFQISYVPSASVLVAQKNERVQPARSVNCNYFAVGDPVYRDKPACPNGCAHA